MEASAPTGPHIEPEPREWQPRAMWVGARLLCGAAAFFFMAFVFAYFYLRSLNVHHAWKIGSVHPSLGLGIAIAVVLIASAALLRTAGAQPTRTVSLGFGALALAVLAVVLQVVEWFDAGLRRCERRLRERVHRLDGAVRRARARLAVLDRDPGRRRVAGAPRGSRRAAARS